MACLSSRIPEGIEITPKKLLRVGKAESFIKNTFDIKVLRVRDHEGLARIELAFNERIKLCNIEAFDIIDKKLKEFGFKYVSLDLKGYINKSEIIK